LSIERERIASAERIAQLNVQAKAEMEESRMQTQQLLEGTKLGAKYAYDNKKLTADQEHAASKMEADQLAKGTQMGMQAMFKKDELAHKDRALMQQKTKPEGETE